MFNFVGQWIDDLKKKNDKMWDYETKYLSFHDMRDYRLLCKDVQWMKIKMGLALLLATTVLYCLMFLLCWFTGLNFWYVDAPFMALFGVSLTMVIAGMLYDRGKRIRQMMDDTYMKMVEKNDEELP